MVLRRGKFLIGEPFFEPGLLLALGRRGGAEAEPGDLVLVEPSPQGNRGRIVERLGSPRDLEAQLVALAAEAGARRPFPDEAVEQARALPADPQPPTGDRHDYRDRLAFIRICSGVFERGMVVTHARTGRPFATKYAQHVFGRERESIDVAYPGDVVGLVNATELRIGDSLYVDEPVTYPGIPTFAPEVFATPSCNDTSRVKQFRQGLEQLDEVLAPAAVVDRVDPAALTPADDLPRGIGDRDERLAAAAVDADDPRTRHGAAPTSTSVRSPGSSSSRCRQAGARPWSVMTCAAESGATR